MLKKILLLLSFYTNFISCVEKNRFKQKSFKISKIGCVKCYTTNDRASIEIAVEKYSLNNDQKIFFDITLLHRIFLLNLGKEILEGRYKGLSGQAKKIYSEQYRNYQKFKQQLETSLEPTFEKFLSNLLIPRNSKSGRIKKSQ